jgi:multiple sugar transport system substrate-binding protein/sn-glycerol 3-phosphate transport system substrate-binding protein
MKRLLVLLSLLLPAFLVSAQDKGLAGVDPRGTTIVFWYQHSGSNGDAMQKMIGEFNAANPWKITVKGEYAGPYDQVYNKMVAAIAAHNPPELVVAYQNQAATYAVNDALVDLNPYVQDPRWGLGKDRGDFIEGFINQDVNAQFGGKRLGFPPNRSIEVMYCNMAMLKSVGITAPPRTWDEFAEDCRKVTRPAGGTYGYALDSLDASHVFSAVITRGGDFARADGKGYALNTTPIKATFLYMKGLVQQGLARKIPKRYDDQSEFGSGVAAFTLGSTSGLSFYDRAVKANKNGPFAWRIAPIPQLTTTAVPEVDLFGASVSVPKSTPEKQLAAWLFIRWFSEPRQQAAWTHVSLYFPVRKAAEPLIKDLLDADASFAAAWTMLKTAHLRSEPPFAGYDLVRDSISAAYNRVLDGADVDRTLAALQAQAEKIYRDAGP